ncbi:MAG: tetratricopeptide repeat protein [Opitutales bacterium]
MTADPPAPRPTAPDKTRTGAGIWLAVAVLVLVTIAAYANSLHTPFIFDDGPSILKNPTIRQLTSVDVILQPPGDTGQTVGGRPLLNFSLAVSYALSGLDPWGYHGLNVGIHVLAALALFGVVRRTLLLPRWAGRFGATATLPALAAALLWAVHPLQTESVTYVIQRAESLAGLFYLVTLYAYIRGATGGSRGWWGTAVAGCLAGMATKETMVTAPVVIALYDRVFLADSFRTVWRDRKGPLLGLAATWGLLAILVVDAAGRGGSAGFGQGMSVWAYALTQAGAVVHYLRLVLWPNPLVVDYGNGLVAGPAVVLPQVLLLAGLGTAIIWAWPRWPAAAFAGAAFFLLLAPSSSLVPVLTQTMAEHRMYLPLAPLCALVAAAAWCFGGRPATAVVLLAGLVLLPVTWARNRLYQNPLALWRQTLAAAPDNARAHLCLGTALNHEGHLAEAIAEYREALRLKPGYIEVLNNLGIALQQQDRLPEAIEVYGELLHLKPDYPSAHYNFALALMRSGRLDEAITHFRIALQTRPHDPDLLCYLGNVEAATGQFDAALTHFAAALRLRPDFPDAQRSLDLVRRQIRSPSILTP